MDMYEEEERADFYARLGPLVSLVQAVYEELLSASAGFRLRNRTANG